MLDLETEFKLGERVIVDLSSEINRVYLYFGTIVYVHISKIDKSVSYDVKYDDGRIYVLPGSVIKKRSKKEIDKSMRRLQESIDRGFRNSKK